MASPLTEKDLEQIRLQNFIQSFADIEYQCYVEGINSVEFWKRRLIKYN